MLTSNSTGNGTIVLPFQGASWAEHYEIFHAQDVAQNWTEVANFVRDNVGARECQLDRSRRLDRLLYHARRLGGLATRTLEQRGLSITMLASWTMRRLRESNYNSMFLKDMYQNDCLLCFGPSSYSGNAPRIDALRTPRCSDGKRRLTTRHRRPRFLCHAKSRGRTVWSGITLDEAGDVVVGADTKHVQRFITLAEVAQNVCDGDFRFAPCLERMLSWRG